MFTKEELYNRILNTFATVCLEYCLDFENDSTQLDRYIVFKNDVPVLLQIKEILLGKDDNKK